jgi:hypothetical protein
MSGMLVRYDTMCRAIDAAHKVDEVKDIRDQAMALAERFALFVTMRTNEALGPLRALQITGASSVILEQFLEVPKGLWEWQVFPLKYVSMRGHRLIPRPESYSVLFRNDAGSGAPAAIKGRIGVAASPARRAFNRRYTQPLMPGFYTRWRMVLAVRETAIAGAKGTAALAAKGLLEPCHGSALPLRFGELCISPTIKRLHVGIIFRLRHAAVHQRAISRIAKPPSKSCTSCGRAWFAKVANDSQPPRR